MAFDFPNSPAVNDTFSPGAGLPTYTWDGEKWKCVASNSSFGAVRYDVAQSLSAGQQAQGRTNINIHQTEPSPVTDLNTLAIEGTFIATPSNTNTPLGLGYWYLESLAYTDPVNYMFQRATRVDVANGP